MEETQYLNHPTRHISALNWIDKEQKYVCDSSVSLVTSSPNLRSNVKDEEKHGVPVDSSMMFNHANIIRPNESCFSRESLPIVMKSKTQRNNSRESCSSCSQEKENEQPNLFTENFGHMKSDTVIFYTNEESKKYQLEQVLKAWINHRDASLAETSSFAYKTEGSHNVPSERAAKNEVSVSSEVETLMKTLQDSLKRQKCLEQTLAEHEKLKVLMQEEIEQARSQIFKSEAQK